MSHINAETELQKACALLDLVSGDTDVSLKTQLREADAVYVGGDKLFKVILSYRDDNFVYIEGVITLRNGLSYTELIISLNFPIKSFPHNFHICVTDERILNMERNNPCNDVFFDEVKTGKLNKLVTKIIRQATNISEILQRTRKILSQTIFNFYPKLAIVPLPSVSAQDYIPHYMKMVFFPYDKIEIVGPLKFRDDRKAVNTFIVNACLPIPNKDYYISDDNNKSTYTNGDVDGKSIQMCMKRIPLVSEKEDHDLVTKEKADVDNKKVLPKLFQALQHELANMMKLDERKNLHVISKFFGITYDGSKNLCILTEYCNLGTLRDFLRNSDRINEDICKKLARNLLTGLKCLIDCGVVHRELTLDHICLSTSLSNTTRRDSSNDLLAKNLEAKICGFGTCYCSDREILKSMMSEQNILYLAPEVEMSNEGFTYESDIFAIGQLIQTIFLSILPKGQKEDTEENWETLPYYSGARKVRVNKHLPDYIVPTIKGCLDVKGKRRICGILASERRFL